MQSYSDTLFCLFQKVVPQHKLSRLIGKVAEAKTPWLKNMLINQAIRTYKIDLSIAEHDQAEQYSTFNEFFTRSLKPGARPVCSQADAVVSPADGVLSQFGHINNDQFIQAKGQSYSTSSLLGKDDTLAAEFSGGSFATIYLSPSDYHRVHMPWDGKLIETRYIPGKLFSVNQATANGIPKLFARNERLICLFETNRGKMAVILVGAMLVAGIETRWQHHYSPSTHAIVKFSSQEISFERAEELGRFKFGSTVVLLFNESLAFDKRLAKGNKVLMGEGLTLA
ncbi:MAG: phosphatidylserine decarboxylase [Gammaproteobacteria bacterium]|nr:phosphatidylserine decarboxylase [Gammaproteobacteria bacterium]MBQ0838407.1 phosphatidylserine decarboxylase [Gammaproteobacteria bacterium]